MALPVFDVSLFDVCNPMHRPIRKRQRIRPGIISPFAKKVVDRLTEGVFLILQDRLRVDHLDIAPTVDRIVDREQPDVPKARPCASVDGLEDVPAAFVEDQANRSPESLLLRLDRDRRRPGLAVTNLGV